MVSKEIQEIVHLPGPHQHNKPLLVPEICHADVAKAEHRVVVFSDDVASEVLSVVSEGRCSFGGGPEVSHLGWGRWYTLRELEDATNGLCDENVVGEGGYGIVYRGVLSDGTRVAVKNLLNNKYVIFCSFYSFLCTVFCFRFIGTEMNQVDNQILYIYS